ncbi:DNA mismatch repair endonuclease MutL [Natronoarchaeum rubrum]|uniref:DNA mismatch repair endonuclease MutL n=1 Tax=Natronoarchaeum rubrum TaxID=755311 RepID=UPI002111F498|nr:DNA mismatch repair endonuclease MutL [Natronoarchaeum rubrum]
MTDASESGGADTDGTATEIRKLDERTVQRIAAGEVVERPASAVKELVENSLDADASRIEVAVERGGVESIRVRDDGVGMSEADVRAAVREHTTSKIEDVDDLESGVATLGFRGEALHTIGAVSRTEITTKPRDGDGAGTELTYVGGDVESVEPAGCPDGTTVEVTELFFNTPARKKYLKTEATEFAHVNRVVTQYALANPEVAVSLEHDGREVFATTGQGDLQSTLLSVYGKDVAASMIGVDAAPDVGSEFPEGPLEGISGYVSHPETTRSSREYVSTFVNGRYVRSPAVREAILEAYGGQLASDRYPFVVLFLEVPAETVDVNVHPRKMEIRWGDEAGVRRQVRAAVEDALLDHGLVRSSAPRGRSAPEEASIAPDADEHSSSSPASTSSRQDAEDEPADDDDGPTADDEFDSVDSEGSAATDAPAAPETSDSPTAGGDAASASGASEESAGVDTEPASAADQSTESASGESASSTTDESTSSPDDVAGRDADAASTERSEPLESATGTPDADDAAAADGDATATDADTTWTVDDEKFTGPHDQRTLGGDVVDDERRFDSLPRLRVMGQLQDTYVVAETDEGLALIDQHAADERVNYERLKAEFEGDTTAQALANPVELELTAGEAALFDEYREALAKLGFYAERDGRRASVSTVPAVLDETLAPERLRDVLTSFIEGEADDGGEAAVESLADEFIADLACYPSITGNTSLREGSVVELLDELDDCENPWACPHGRPVVIEIDAEELDDRFERDYPGHGGRRD